MKMLKKNSQLCKDLNKIERETKSPFARRNKKKLKTINQKKSKSFLTLRHSKSISYLELKEERQNSSLK